MTKSNLYPIVSLPNVNIFIPKTSHFSIGTSPYYAHQKAVAIDIYDRISIENYDVISPISGKILQIKQLQAPKPRFKDGIDKEYLILVKNPDDKNTVFKILHIKPKLEVGQKVERGDILGKTIRNGYFAPWSSPHLHLELKKPEEALRAKGGLNFTLNSIEDSFHIQKTNKNDLIPVEIKFKFKEFFLCQFPEEFYYYLNPFYGIKARLNDITCVIDGGIPIYRSGVVHFQSNIESINNSPSVIFNNIPIGTLTGINKRFGYVKFLKIKFLLNSKEIRGVSLFLGKFRPLVKLVPYSAQEFDFDLNTTQFLSVEK